MPTPKKVELLKAYIDDMKMIRLDTIDECGNRPAYYFKYARFLDMMVTIASIHNINLDHFDGEVVYLATPSAFYPRVQPALSTSMTKQGNLLLSVEDTIRYAPRWLIAQTATALNQGLPVFGVEFLDEEPLLTEDPEDYASVK